MPYRSVGRPCVDSGHGSSRRLKIDLPYLVVLIWVAGFGAAGAAMAVQRHRSPVIWAGLGAVIGPVALVLLRIAPPGRCPMCWAPASGWTWICQWCGSDLRSAVDPAGAGGAAMAAQSDRSDRPPAQAAPVSPTPPAARSATQTAGRLAGGTRVIASALYVTGSVSLRPGSWYTLELERGDFRVRGPMDEDPRATPVTRPLASLEASAFEDRLVLNGMKGTVMVFMRPTGDTAERLADAINEAARAIPVGVA
jgi:hypothetical protein